MGSKIFKNRSSPSPGSRKSPASPQHPKSPTTSETQSNRPVDINKSYLFNKYHEGFLRLGLIVALMGGWISAAAAPGNYDLFFSDMLGEFSTTRTAYLVIVVSAFLFSIAVFLANLIRVNKLRLYKHVVDQALLVIIIIDALYCLTIFAVSVTVAARESQLGLYGSYIYSIVNRGAFGMAAFFGFISFIILLFIIAVSFINLRSGRTQIPSTFVKTAKDGSREIPIQVYDPPNSVVERSTVEIIP